MAALGGKADLILLVFQQFELPLSALSGHSSDKENPAQTGVVDQRDDAHGGAAVRALERIDLVNLLNQPGPVGLPTCIHGWLVADD